MQRLRKVRGESEDETAVNEMKLNKIKGKTTLRKNVRKKIDYTFLEAHHKIISFRTQDLRTQDLRTQDSRTQDLRTQNSRTQNTHTTHH